MDTGIQERLGSGLLCLYSATSKTEFYLYLESFFADIFPNLEFAVLSESEQDGWFSVEYHSNSDADDLQRQRVASEILAESLHESNDERSEDASIEVEGVTLDLDGRSFQVSRVLPLSARVSPSSYLLFGEDPVFLGEDLFGLEEYVLDHVGAAFRLVDERDNLNETVELQRTQLHAVAEFSDVVGQLDLEVVLSHLLAVCGQLTGAQVSSVRLLGGVGNSVHWGLPDDVLTRLRPFGREPLVERALARNETILVSDYAADETLECIEEYDVRAFLCVPLASRRRVLGTINLVNADPDRGGQFSDRDALAVSTISRLAATAIENAVLHREQIEKEKIEANLQVARSIQRGMFPVKALEVPGYEMSWYTRSCDETGGDYFDFMELKGERLGLAIGDVSGHGMGAALLMATGRASLRALLSVREDVTDVMERLNDLLGDDLDIDKFMTLYLGMLSYRDHSFSYVSAGHDHPLLFVWRSREVIEFSATGTPLGMFPGATYELGRTFSFEPGDVFVLCTDGVWEAKNGEGRRYGKERLIELIRLKDAFSPEELVETIVADVEAHLDGAPYEDDLTLAVIRRQGQPPRD